MIHPKLIRICFRSRILTKKSILSRLFYNVLHMPGDLQPKIPEIQLYRFTYHSKSVQFLPRLFSKRPFFVRRQCRACATKIPWIPECIRRRAACSKLVRAMGRRYGEGSRRRPGWRSPSISSKPSGANGRGEGTWQGKVLGCRCKFNVYLALFIRYYIYIYNYICIHDDVCTIWCLLLHEIQTPDPMLVETGV